MKKTAVFFQTGLRLFCLFCFVFILFGCAKEYDHQKATASVSPDKVVNRDGWSASGMSNGSVLDGWIASFNDPVLDKLVAEAIANNPGLQSAAAKVEQSWAQAAIAGAELMPTIGFGANLAGVTASDWTPKKNGAGLGISWEADLWGRLSLAASSAEESARSVQADYDFARQSLAASTARAWFLASEAEIQVAFLKQVVGLLEKMSAIVEKKKDVGQVGMQDVHQVHARLAGAKDASARAEIARQESARGLELLLGRYPGAEIKGAADLTPLPGPIPTGMPSSILSRRPDLIAAEDRVAAAFYAEEGAKLLHLPRFVIQGGGGVSGLDGAIAGLAGGLFAPLYTGGAIEAQIDQVTAVQKQSVADYGAAALQAFKEVEEAIGNDSLLKERLLYLEEAEEDNRKAYELADIQYKVGKIDLFQTLELQARWIGSEVTLIDVHRQALDNRINLHLALGGSFEELK